MEVAGIATAPDATALAWRFHCEDAESARSARASFVEYLGRRGVKDEALAGAELVFGELLANAVRHAPGPIDISLSWEDLVPVLTVSDRGPGIREPAGTKLPEDVLSQAGRGLFLVRALAGDPNISQRSERGTEIAVPLLIVSPES
ncbi:MAG TPA: ATP-binding protein [Xanthomonadales bacterium]|nr:ATP-binding protein [Xanthomonadales bacterium]